MGWPAADGGGKRKRAVLGSLSSWSRSGMTISMDQKWIHVQESWYEIVTDSVAEGSLELGSYLGWSEGHIPRGCGWRKPLIGTEACIPPSREQWSEIPTYRRGVSKGFTKAFLKKTSQL